MTGVGVSTVELQAYFRPLIADLAASLGQDIAVNRVQDDPTAEPDEYGQRPKVTVSPVVRGIAYQLDATTRARMAAGGSLTGVPDWEVILPFEAPVAEPGFTLSVLDPQDPLKVLVDLRPTGDAQDPGTQGLAWIIRCTSPRAREGAA